MHCPLCGTSDGVHREPSRSLQARIDCKWCKADLDVTVEVQRAPDLIQLMPDGTQVRWGKYAAIPVESGRNGAKWQAANYRSLRRQERAEPAVLGQESPVERSRKLREFARQERQKAAELREQNQYLKFQLRQCLAEIDLPNQIAKRGLNPKVVRDAAEGSHEWTREPAHAGYPFIPTRIASLPTVRQLATPRLECGATPRYPKDIR